MPAWHRAIPSDTTHLGPGVERVSTQADYGGPRFWVAWATLKCLHAAAAVLRSKKASGTLVSPRARRAVYQAVCVALFWWTPVNAAQSAAVEQPRSTAFAELIARLSEPGGDFGGDNLISNEQSYLHVMPALASAAAQGGGYVGVGPDQNFSYIGHSRSAIAYIIDIRRDNLLLHLLFKALFAETTTRVGYLSLLTGRPAPESSPVWRDASIDTIVKYIDAAKPLGEAEAKPIQTRLERTIKGFGVPLTSADLETIASCHRQFVAGALSLVFQVRGQPVRSYYPSLRTFLLETDRGGHQLSFLASEPAFQHVRSLQARDLIVPVVGDVSGPKAMRAIAADLTSRGEALSVLYISNVEYYLFRARSFQRYAENLQRMPRREGSTVIRSVFPSGGSGRLAQSVPGFYSTSLVQPLGAMLEDLAAAKYPGYPELIEASSR